MGPCFHYQSHPQLGVVSAFALSLHSFWSYFSTDLQKHTGHLPTWGVHLSVSYLFAFSYCSWGSQGKNTEVVCPSLLQWTTFCQWSHYFMANRWGNNRNSDGLDFLGLQITAGGDCSHEIKRHLLLGRKVMLY